MFNFDMFIGVHNVIIMCCFYISLLLFALPFIITSLLLVPKELL